MISFAGAANCAEDLPLVLLDQGRIACSGAPEDVLTAEVLEPV